MRKSLTKREILTRKEDIDNVFAVSSRANCNGAKLLYTENGYGFNRILVTLVRKYGNSVERNRAKRIMKELFRNAKHSIKPGYDMIFVIYPGHTSFKERQTQFETLLSKAGLMI